MRLLKNPRFHYYSTPLLHYSFFGLGCELQIYLVD